MQTTFFTSDLHLGHASIVELAHRPFLFVDDMDDTLVNNLNRSVSRGDLLYILGDFSLKNFALTKTYRERINCANVFLIRGNHDRLTESQYRELFSGVYDIKDVKVCGHSTTLCHYAMRRWNKSHYGAYHLYGHSHGCLADDASSLCFDVGVDCHNMLPLSEDKVQQLMEGKIANGATFEPNH